MIYTGYIGIMEKKMEVTINNRNSHLRLLRAGTILRSGCKPARGYRPPLVHRVWGMLGSYYNIPKAKFYLLKGDYKPPSFRNLHWSHMAYLEAQSFPSFGVKRRMANRAVTSQFRICNYS